MFGSLLKRGLVLYACFFILGGFLAPLFAHQHQFAWADWWYSLLAGSCQQQGTRSFWLLGYPMAICARCLGLYIGFVLLGLRWCQNQFKATRSIMWLLLAVALSEKVMEWTVWESNNFIRLLAGGFLGAGLLTLLVLIVEKLRRVLNRVFNEKSRLFGA